MNHKEHFFYEKLLLKRTLKLQKILQICLRNFVNFHPETLLLSQKLALWWFGVRLQLIKVMTKLLQKNCCIVKSDTKINILLCLPLFIQTSWLSLILHEAAKPKFPLWIERYSSVHKLHFFDLHSRLLPLSFENRTICCCCCFCWNKSDYLKCR